ncbi:hypothetical protein [uncultured Clostridium sp.]|jgi:chromosome segregation ATPase|uniref:hypothetical protein n=1 Tax=uncultured Clostridium sp. TaxID=59620 RepID=UPI0026338035|nr:hypothetical protein [uncultured Clostridium sp.]
MAKVENKELKVKSFRVDEGTFAKFKDIASNEFGNQSQCLEALVNIYETEESKSVLVGRELEIESFQDYINKISRLFVTSLQLSSDAEDRAKEGFLKKLDAKDEALTILKAKLDSTKEDFIELKTSNKNSKLELSDKEKKIEELESAKNILSQLSNRNYDLVIKLEGELDEYKSKNEELSLLKETFKLKDKSITDLSKKLTDITSENNLLEVKVSNLTLNINEYKDLINTKNIDIKALQALIESIKREYLTEITTLKSNFEEELSKKIIENESLLRREFELDKRELELKIKELELKIK